MISERLNWIRGRFDHSKGFPPQVQVVKIHLPGLTDRCHELRRKERSFRGRRIQGDVRPPGRIPLFQWSFLQ
jgi:hypothetical protein